MTNSVVIYSTINVTYSPLILLIHALSYSGNVSIVIVYYELSAHTSTYFLAKRSSYVNREIDFVKNIECDILPKNKWIIVATIIVTNVKA